MLPDPDAIRAAVARERALAWTLGAALYGAAGLLFGRTIPLSAAAVPTLVAFGVLGWTASHHRGGASSRLAWLAVGGALFSLPAALASVERLFEIALVAALGGALLAGLGWSLDGRLATLGDTLEDADVASAFATKWLLAVAATVGLVGLWQGAAPLAVASGLVALVSAARWAVARDRVTSRRRWLRDARDGADPRWTVQPRAGFEPKASALTPLANLEPLDGALVPRAEATPYRGQPQALVPLVGGRPTAARWSRPFTLRPAIAWLVVVWGTVAWVGWVFPGDASPASGGARLTLALAVLGAGALVALGRWLHPDRRVAVVLAGAALGALTLAVRYALYVASF